MDAEKTLNELELPTELGRLASLIDEEPEGFASGDSAILEAALAAAKYIFDLTLKSESRAQPHLKDFLESIGLAQAPQTRTQTRLPKPENKEKAPPISYSIANQTPLPALFVDDMSEEQVWAQLELKSKNVCQTLEETFDAGDMEKEEMLDSGESQDEDEDELYLEELEELKKSNALDAGDWDMDEESGEDDGEGDSESSGHENLEEKSMGIRDPSSDEDNIEDEEDRMDLDAGPSSGRVTPRRNPSKRHAGLDDDFFSLADFNAEIEEAEAKNVSRGSLSKGSDDEESDEDNTIDFFASVDDKEQLEENGGETFYKDFFDPPPRSARTPKRKADAPAVKSEKHSKVRFNEQVKVKTIKARGKGLQLSGDDFWTRTGDNALDEEGDSSTDESSIIKDKSDNNLQDDDSDTSHLESETKGSDQGWQALERVKDDLFADGDDDDTPKSGLSAYEARMEVLRKQIAELEAENIGEKDWVLKGEVTSRARPQNALLEEDLEFERVAKAVPVITDEVVHDLETRIRARVVEGRFDDVVRKRAVDDKPFLPSRVFEVQDTKSKESLAQIYEDEYLASQSGGVTNDRDARLQKEHEEIEKQWESICYKLDALCNAHFTPKQPKATISTVSNVSAVSLESALPTAKSASTTLAPEEVFASDAAVSRSKSELTPAEKQALRTKERKKKKKQRQLLETSVDKFAQSKKSKGVKMQKQDALKSLVKTGKGVTVIGKEGRDLKKGKRQRQ